MLLEIKLRTLQYQVSRKATSLLKAVYLDIA